MTTYKERRNNKCTCECGGKYLLANKALHNRSKKHQRFLETGDVFVSKMPYRISSKRYNQLNEEDRAIKCAYYKIYNKNRYITERSAKPPKKEEKHLIMV